MPTEFQSPDIQLPAHVRRCIDEGRLPVYLPDSLSAGYGSGSTCHACDRPIASSEVQYDVEDPRNGRARFSVHLGCYVLWQTECVKRIRQQQQDSRWHGLHGCWTSI